MRRYQTLLFLLIMWIFSPQVGAIASPFSIINSAIDPTIKVSYYPNPCPKVLNIDVAFEKNTSQIEIHFRSMIGKDVIEFINDDKTSFNPDSALEKND